MKGVMFSLLIFCLSPSLAYAETEVTPRGVVEDRYRAIDKIIAGDQSVEAMRDEIKGVMETFVDYRELSRLTIKTHWSELSSKKKDEFISLFKQLIQRSYAKRFKKDKKLQVVYEGDAEIRKGKARLNTEVTSGDTTVEVEYRFHQPESKKGWWAYDIVIDDVSLMRNYRKQFYDILQADGVDGLFVALRERVEAKTE